MVCIKVVTTKLLLDIISRLLLQQKSWGKISNISDRDWYKEFYQSELPLKEKAVSIMTIISVLNCFMNLRDIKLIIVNSISKMTKGVSI